MEAPCYAYFVSFTYRWLDINTQQFSNLEIEMPRPITEYNHIRIVGQKCKEVLEAQYAGETPPAKAYDLVVLNYQLLRFDQPRHRKISSSRRSRPSRRLSATRTAPAPG